MSSNKCQPISKTLPLIKLPFPPIISASDILNRRKPSRITSKSPNAFLIYRKAFLDQLSLLNRNLRMTEVSKLVSSQWKNETESVKDAYRKISQQVEVELSEKRKNGVSCRVVWKNSKYSSSRKKNRLGKISKSKSEIIQSNTKFKAATNRGNIFYQFVPAFPDAEVNSESSKKNDIPSSNTENLKNLKNLSNSQENSQNLVSDNESINYQVPNELNELNELNQPCSQFTEIPIPTNLNSEPFIEPQRHLICDENIQLGLDWYLQNFENFNFM